MTKRLILFVTSLALMGLGNFSALAQNNEPQWWFNVELIVFKRALLPDNSENFASPIPLDGVGVGQNNEGAANNIPSNNFLYLAALQQAFNFQSYRAALPLCAPDTQYLSTESSARHDELRALLVPFKTIDAFAMRDTPNDSLNILRKASVVYSRDENSIDTPSNPELVINEEAFQLHKEALNRLTKRTAIINKQLDEIIATTILLSCIDSPAEISLSRFILPNIGPRLLSDNSYFRGKNQLLAQSDLVLEDFAKSIAQQRDITPLFHTAWRQEVEFGIENAEFIRIRAGKLLETSNVQSYEQWLRLYKLNNTEGIEDNDAQFFASLQQSLENNEAVEWLASEPGAQNNDASVKPPQKQYEIEGKIKVYLDYVSQVPYLHIDSEFNRFSLAIDEFGHAELMAYPSAQRRRVISKQIHYFDHPAFGVIVRIERFTPPIGDEAVMSDIEN